ncbi:hypothetical protein GCM10022226_61780 [Sphaerisporangium flaviroseum]|uniref:Transposase n=1 Tax=Sphaerisporangium flaviroseum TaxID=509199 RepID=A0ABP7J1C5_9ACTN
MSRTVHHTPLRHRMDRLVKTDELWVPGTFHQITTLRYSQAAVTQGVREGTRPRPETRTPRFAAYHYARAVNVRRIKRVADRHERVLRATTRAVSHQVLQVLAAAADRESAAWEVDFPEPRHRGQALWESY